MEPDKIKSEIIDINEAMVYCLTGVSIEGCISPSLLEDTMERLKKLAEALDADR